MHVSRSTLETLGKDKKKGRHEPPRTRTGCLLLCDSRSFFSFPKVLAVGSPRKVTEFFWGLGWWLILTQAASKNRENKEWDDVDWDDDMAIL